MTKLIVKAVRKHLCMFSNNRRVENVVVDSTGTQIENVGMLWTTDRCAIVSDCEYVRGAITRGDLALLGETYV